MMSSVIGKSVRNVFSRRMEEVKKELTDIQKLGIHFTLGLHNSSQAELELDALDVMDDPLNDADFKIRRIFRLIVLNYKYVAPYDNPRVAPLIAACNGIMSKWNIVMNKTKNSFGNFITVEMEVPYALPKGLFQIRVERQNLAYPVFGHQYAQYMSTSDWQQEQMTRLYGKKEDKWKFLKFTPVGAGVERQQTVELTQEQREITEGVEYFASTEIVYRLWTIYSWMQREKFSFPDTPIVVQAQPPMMGGMGGRPVPTSSFMQTSDKPSDDGTPGIQTMG